jgi:hypothetical protein
MRRGCDLRRLRRTALGLAAGVLLVVLPEPVGADEPFVVRPEPLARLQKALDGLDQQVSRVKGPGCPDLDPKHAERVAVALAEVEDVLAFYPGLIERIRQTARDHFLQAGGQTVRQEAELARLQYVFAWQDWVLATMKATLDLADVASLGNDIIDTLKSNPKGVAGVVDLARRQQVLGWIGRMNDAAQAAEGALSLGEAARANGESWWKAYGSKEGTWGAYKPPDFSEIEALRQSTQELHGLLESTRRFLAAEPSNLAEVIKHGEDMQSGLVSFAGSLAQGWGSREHARFAARIGALDGLVRAEQQALRAAWQERRHYASERFKVDVALARLRRIRQAFAVDVRDYFGPPQFRLWAPPVTTTGGEALRTAEQELPKRVDALVAALSGFTMRPSVKPALTVGRSRYSPGEAMTVRFQAPTCLSQRAWAGIVPAQTPHGSARVNDERTVSSPQRYLMKRREGILSFTAPTAAGSYEVRMNGDSDGIELVAVPFAVSSEVVVPLDPSPGTTLQAIMGEARSDRITVRDRVSDR